MHATTLAQALSLGATREDVVYDYMAGFLTVLSTN
jgi:hypothetical protein